MSPDDKRAYVMAMYPHSPRWRRRVKAMSDAQVTAIYIKAVAKAKERPKHDDDDQQDAIPF